MENKYTKLNIEDHEFDIADISAIKGIEQLPFSYRILIENILRQQINGSNINAQEQIQNILDFKVGKAINFMPNRILSHDILGKVMLVDFLAYREALAKKGIDPKDIQPKVPIDLVIDHSSQVDFFGTEQSRIDNLKKEYERNSERFSFLRWCSKNLKNVKVVPPGVGICHQVNIEYLAKVVWLDKNTLHPDTCIGTDSHTPMVNGIGVMGWGVGGVEAEIAMFGKSLPITIPEVIGVNLKNELNEGITSTDLVLNIIKMLRDKSVVGKFVEFYGEGLKNLTLADRATIANMAPEYGATNVLFPVDESTIDYLEMTGREPKHINIIREYSKHQKLWRNITDTPNYSRNLELDLSSIKRSLACSIFLRKFNLDIFSSKANSHSQELYKKDLREDSFKVPNLGFEIKDADILIASLSLVQILQILIDLYTAALVAKNLVNLGLKKNKKVKTSFAPGSKVTAEILKKSGLQSYLDQLGFNVVGIACTTCNGSSGPLHPDIAETIEDNKIFSVALLSGNRNFQGRIHPNIRASYLASPALIVLFSILGSIKKDLFKDSLGLDKNNKEIFFKDVWPTNKEINEVVKSFYNPKIFIEKYSEIDDGGELWEKLNVSKSENYEWSEKSTFIKKPPYLEIANYANIELKNINSARPIALFGDSVTTDHISPSSVITKGTAAWDYLEGLGLDSKDFSNFLTRRANHEIVSRSSFASLRLRNLMTPNSEGGFTKLYPEEKVMPVYNAVEEYKEENTEIIVIAGENYGCGSSRDVAAKGPLLLGIKAVIAESFERIHRSNLVGMGVLPLRVFDKNNGIEELGIAKTDRFSVLGIKDINDDNKILDLSIKNKMAKKLTQS